MLPTLNSSVGFAHNISDILQQLDGQQKQVFGVTLWSLWKHRNIKLWNEITESVQTICERARNLLTFWKNAQVTRNQWLSQVEVKDETKWTKPSIGMYKCNVDASFSESLNTVGIGICIRDDEGRCVLARSEWISPLVDVDLGEVLGMLSALQWVHDLQLVNMDFETDSKTIVDSIYDNKQGISDFHAIINECRYLLSSDLVTSDVRFIWRQVNEVAHILARDAPYHASFHTYIRIPSCISTIIMNEMH